MSTTLPNLAEIAAEIPGIEVRHERPSRCQRYLRRPFWPDQADEFRQILRGISDRRSVFVAPDSSDTFTIYKKPASMKTVAHE